MEQFHLHKGRIDPTAVRAGEVITDKIVNISVLLDSFQGYNIVRRTKKGILIIEIDCLTDLKHTESAINRFFKVFPEVL